MTQNTLTEVQDYLTIIAGDHKKRIVDIRMLLRTHSTKSILQFMRGLLREYEKKLRIFITTDKTNPEMNEIISTMFRLHMAIKCIEDEEVKKVDQFKQRAGKGGKFSRRNRRRNSRPWKRQNQDNDGKDRQTDNEARCSA